MVRNPSPLLHAALALLALVVATMLAVYKPRGMTRYGQRKLRKQRRRTPATTGPAVDRKPDLG
jgi:hypothetical protein